MVDLLAAGISLGAIYCLAGLGFVLVFNATGAVNFAHGDLVVLGGLIGAATVTSLGIPPLLIIVAIPVAMFPIGLLLEKIAFRPLRKKNFSSAITISIAVSIIISSLLLIILGPQPRTMPALIGGQVSFGGDSLPWQSIVIVLFTLLMCVLQWWLFQKTRLGFMLRASAEDPDTARLMGIRVDRMTGITVGLATTYAGIAGVLLAPIVILSSSSGSSLILKIYVAVVIGGIGSAVGAIVGGLALGLLEVMTAAYVSSSYVDALIFSLLFVVLLIRPQGVFGRVEVRV